MPQYGRNTAKVSVKHQSMLVSMLSIFLPVIGLSMFSKIPAGFVGLTMYWIHRDLFDLVI
jgi:membrane protein insertase Oxa1/YidC/SpoIIIJ